MNPRVIEIALAAGWTSAVVALLLMPIMPLPAALVVGVALLALITRPVDQ